MLPISIFASFALLRIQLTITEITGFPDSAVLVHPKLRVRVIVHIAYNAIVANVIKTLTPYYLGGMSHQIRHNISLFVDQTLDRADIFVCS